MTSGRKDLLRFDTTNGTPDNLEGIAPHAGLFFFTSSNGKASATGPLPHQKRQSGPWIPEPECQAI